VHHDTHPFVASEPRRDLAQSEVAPVRLVLVMLLPLAEPIAVTAAEAENAVPSVTIGATPVTIRFKAMIANA
jgi:hypothetical protein